jgi:hypothetical protein
MSKFTSRKFLAALTGVITGIALIISGNIIEGASTVITSIVAYIMAEGYIDGKAVRNTVKISQEVLDNVVAELEEDEVVSDGDNT